jgi:hypothetical protein
MCLVFVLSGLITSALAATPPQFATATRDTQFLIGPWSSEAQANGQFETPTGLASWNEWTHRDETEVLSQHWQISDYNAHNLQGGTGNLAAWCGDISLAACPGEDSAGGYGANWKDAIAWTGTVGDPTQPVTVQFSAVANIDSEPGYDMTRILVLLEDGYEELASFDGQQAGLTINENFTVDPADYQGENADQVVLWVDFASDGAFDDEDCLRPSAGAVQIDDIAVTLGQGGWSTTSLTDFENGWNDWAPATIGGVGDFTQIWSNLEDDDPCLTNDSPQVAFIDDGEVVPGVGPTHCMAYCYGPEGYVVNPRGGALGSDFMLHNRLVSPVLTWPEGDLEGCRWSADLYLHQLQEEDSPLMVVEWAVRSTASSNPADIEEAPWHTRGEPLQGGPHYVRPEFEVAGLLVPGRQFVQFSLSLRQTEPYFTHGINQSTPAPYIDNVRLVCYPQEGPFLAAREIDLAGDGFPASGELDLANLGANSVRFDMAVHSSWPEEMSGIPGDSIVVDVALLRQGAELVGLPELHWQLIKNPVFDPYRTSEYGTAWEGVSYGFPAVGGSGPVEGKWAFDLPDEHFLFPGDVLHYFIQATDSNDQGARTAIMPADTTGFSTFAYWQIYDPMFTVRALPSVNWDVFNPGELVIADILFWDDSGDPDLARWWYESLIHLGLLPGLHFDTYSTRGAALGAGNGLGGRASADLLEPYATLLYSSGTQESFTLNTDDLAVVDTWLGQGDNDLFLAGDKLVTDLTTRGGSAGDQFVSDWMRVSLVDDDLAPLVGRQTAPRVKSILGNGVFPDGLSWIANGDCPSINRFDAVEPQTGLGAVRLAEFCDVQGNGGVFPYSAATIFQNPQNGSKVISLPYDLGFVSRSPQGGKVPGPLGARDRVLKFVLFEFGYPLDGPPLPVPEASSFAVKAYPNPFNPLIRIQFNLPRASHLELKVFNVRGELVRTLLDDHHSQGQDFVTWAGQDQAGHAVASGVYFYQLVWEGGTVRDKIVLLR